MSLTITPGPKVLNLYFTTPTGRIYVDDDANTPLSTQVEESSTTRDDLLDLKVWISTVNGFTPDNTNLKYDKLFQSNLVLSDLLPGTIYYIKYAYISKIDPDSYTISSQVSATTDTDVSLLTLDTTDWAFIFEDSTATTANYPASITFTANKQNITGTPIFTATAYNSSNTSLGSVTLTGTGDNRVLTSANFNSLGATTVRYVKVVATLGTLSDTVTIWRGDNGSNALTFILTNEAHTVPADSSGNVTSYTGAITYGAIFRGIINETSLWTITKTDGTGLATTLTGTGTNNITLTVNTLDSATDSAVSTITATRTGYPTLTKDFSISKSKAGNPGNPGLGGIQSITAYRVRNQTDAALTTAPSNTTGAVAPTNYSLTASSVTVGQVLWYTFGRYNPNQTNAVDGIPSNTTVWSVPIAASIFQDIKSDNWNGDSPPTSGNFGTGANAGYYLNKTEGSIYVQQAYVKGTLQAGSFIIGTVKLDNSSGRTLQQIESQAFNAVTTAAFDTTLQTKLTSGVTNILAGQNSNYQLFVAPSGSDKIVACHKDVLTADFSQSTWPISAANTTGVPRTYLFIGPGGIFMGKYADTANATKNHRISIDANGDATFAGTVTATAGSFGGINIDTAKIYTGTGTWGNANTGFYADSAGQFSLKDKLTWDGTTLTIAGSITATSTIDGTTASTIKSGAASGATALQNNDTNKSLGLTGGSIGGATIASTKIYIGTGTWANTNTGFYVDSTGQFSLKDKLTWDGTTLNITGAITATSLTLSGITIPASNISGLAAVATSGSKTDVGLGNVSNLTPQNQAKTGIEAAITITSGGIAMSTGGYVKGGQTDYNTGTGFFLGYSTDNYKFSIGNPSGQRVTWDGSTFTIVGTIDTTSTIAGTSAGTVVSNAAGALQASSFNTTLQNRLNTGVDNIIAGQGADYRLYVETTSNKIVLGHKDVITAYPNAITNAGVAGVARTYLAITSSGILMGYYGTGANATKTDSISINGATGNATFIGTVTATAGSFGGINIDTAKIYTGTGSWGNANTGFYADSAGQFSLKDKLTWNGTTLNITGAITATSLTLSGGATVPASSVSGLATVATTGAAANISGLAAVATSGNKADVALGNVSNLTPQNQAKTGIEAAITITSGGIAMSTGGYVKGGQTDYNTGTGFFLGYSTDNYKFSIGNPSGQKFIWDGTNLSITGAITATSLTLSGGVTVPAASVSGLATVATTGAAANISGLAAVATSGSKTDVGLGNVSNLNPQNQAQTGIEAAITITSGGIAMSTGGYVKGGQTAYNTGTGFFLGYSTDNYKFSIGNPSGQRVTWDGSTFTIVGTIDTTSTIAGTNAGTVVSNAATGASAATTVATKLNKNASDTLTGAINVTTSGGFVAGTLTWDATGTRTGGYGIAMTAKGLVGFDSSGNSTFNISATDGSATFKGAIASGSTISGATVVGGTIQTATSGQRLDINNSGNFTIGSTTVAGLGKIVVLNSSNSVLATFGGTGTNTTNSTGYSTADPLLSMYVPALTTTAVYFAQSLVIPAPTYAIPSNPFSGTIGIQTLKNGVGVLDKGKQVVNIGRYTNDGNNNEGVFVSANGYNSPLTCNVIAEIGSVYRISATEEYCLGADFWTTDGNSSATEKRVQICKSSSDGSGSGGAAINILKGAFIHNGVTIATPPNNTTTYLRGDGTWQSFLGTIAANYVKNGSVASNAIEVRWSGTKAQLYIDNTYISNGFEASSTGGIANAYANITDGTTTAAASASDTFKFRAGTGLSVVVGSNDATHGDNVLITNTGVTSLTGTSNQVTVSASTGVVTLSLPQSISTSSNVQFNRLGVGIAQQGVDGRIDASNDIVSYSSSDRNLKTNIQPVTDPINKLFKLSGNTFTWKPELEHLHGYSGNDLGVIAQEVEDIFPEAVRTNTNGYKSVRYEKLIPLLIEAIKAQQEQIDKLIKLVEGK